MRKSLLALLIILEVSTFGCSSSPDVNLATDKSAPKAGTSDALKNPKATAQEDATSTDTAER